MLLGEAWSGDLTLSQISNVILMRGDRLLLGWRGRDRRAYSDGWAVPGGDVEPGETPEQAAVRESREAVGVTVTDLRRLKPQLKPQSGSLLYFIYKVK